MIIAIASGKGGTGKTTIATNLATFLNRKNKETIRLLDCDVEGANDNLFLNIPITKGEEVKILKPKWDSEKCQSCGKCIEVCHYNALAKVRDQILLFDELCHSCGACSHLCPNNAFEMIPKPLGKLEFGANSEGLHFGQGEVNIGESLSPYVIKKLKESINDDEITILDAPPGTTCPVVTSLTGVDYCLLITEPTPFGASDLRLALELISTLKIRAAVVVNRSDNKDTIIEDICQEYKVPLIGRIPFELRYAKSYSTGNLLIDHHPEFTEILDSIYQRLNEAQIPLSKAVEKNELAPQDDSEERNPSPREVKEIVVISGKGGTGKTTVTSSFAMLEEQLIVADNDVDAANLRLVIKSETFESKNFVGGLSYSILQDKCSECGLCLNLCAFGAIKKLDGDYQIGELGCEGCGLCEQICPSNAIAHQDSISGMWFKGVTKSSAISHAILEPGEENSGKLVATVRNHARELAAKLNRDTILSDGPPGTGCPVISSITGADLAIIVTEPTLSGIHDMIRALELTQYFGVLTRVIINKATINQPLSQKIIEEVRNYKSEVIGQIPFDRDVNEAIKNQTPVVNFSDGLASQEIKSIWKKIKKEVQSVF